MTSRNTLFMFCALAVIAAGAQLALAQQADDRVTVAWSDPGRPGMVRIESLSGGMAVKGSDRKDVLIIARPRGGDRPQPPSQGGLRRLTQTGGFEVQEARNVMHIESATMRTIDFEVHVPLRTHLSIDSLNAGTVTVENVDGDMEIENLNGPVTLTNIAGSVVVDATNGAIKATMTRLNAAKAMAFTSLNGLIDVTLPASARANLKLRSDMGDVYTDFDIQLGAIPAPQGRENRRGGGGTRVEVNKSITGTINGGGPEIELRSHNGSVYLRKGQ